MKEHFTLRYSSSEDNDTIMDLEMTFDNPSDEALLKRLNAWLVAIGKGHLKMSSATNSWVIKCKNETHGIDETHSIDETHGIDETHSID